MKKLENTNTRTMTTRARSELKRHYTISVCPKDKGFQARVTLKIIGGGKNPRITAYSGVSAKDAVSKILLKMCNQMSEYKRMNLLKKEICVNIYDSIMISIQNLQMSTDANVMKSASLLFQILTSTDEVTIPNTIHPQTEMLQNTGNISHSNNIFQKETSASEEQVKRDFFEQNQISPITSKPFKEVAEEWFEYKKALTKKTDENPKPLSPKTVEGYHSPLKDILIPYFNENKNISLITEKDLKKLLNSVSGYRTKECVYIVTKMVFDFAREKNYIYYTPRIKKPQKPYKDEEESIIFIETDRQDVWLDYFETENTDISLLFETMLLTGLRPEEACGLKWCAIDENANELIINNAYKDYPVYDGMVVIGHTRGDGRLKTPESYRRIPLNSRLKKRLLEHKEKQKRMFKLFKTHWNENSYMFVNQYRRPYVPENLSKCMRTFISKYELEYMTPYGLRHSFATFCSEQGMEEIVLMKLMGHSDFNTTQKYYICVSSKRKKQAMQQVYKHIFDEDCRTQKMA